MDAIEFISEYKERFERIKLAMEQIEDVIKASDQRPVIDEAVWNELGDMESDIGDIEETLFDMNIKLYQLAKGKYEIKNISIVGDYIRPVKN